MDKMENNLKNIHDASLQVLETVGVRLHHRKVLEIAADNGVKVSDGKIFFGPESLMEWISIAPSEFTLFARNPACNMHIGGERTEHVSYNSGFPYILDREGRRRSAFFSDYLNFLKLVHATPEFKINGGVMVTPEDIPSDELLYPKLLYATLLHSDKCIFGGMGGKSESEMTMEMLKAV